MTSQWEKLVISNFGEAACKYNKNADIQKFYAAKLTEICSKQIINSGLWLDLGSGTGFLADALEEKKANQSVIRIDGSQKMLQQHDSSKLTKLFDLSSGLPPLKESPTLIASNFALHWLNKPKERLQEWFNALAPKGWLAITLPVKGSFPEWYDAAAKANVNCTAMQFPSHDLLTDWIKIEKIKLNKIERFSQQAPKINSLLKPLVHVGGHTTPFSSLTIGQWRRIHRAWETSKDNHLPQLTWLIQILLIQK